ncbi:MAG: alpha/beta hydrolase [Lautropia sp.]
MKPVAPNPPDDPRTTVVRDVIYGSGQVGYGGAAAPVSRPLGMDVYLPAVAGRLRPCILFAFGGGFHRGSKENDAFFGPEGNTSVAEYCRRFAEHGYVAVAFDYRLVPEHPFPGDTRAVLDPDAIPRSRIDEVRKLMGLGPLDNASLWRGVEAAADDMALATRYVRQHAARWSVDPERIAVGGFSAGARTALNVAFAEQVPVRAVVALSGSMEPADRLRHIVARDGAPPVLVIHAENDIDHIRAATPGLVAHIRAAGLQCEHFEVPGAGHFYPAASRAVDDAGHATTVEQAILTFLARHLGAAKG